MTSLLAAIQASSGALALLGLVLALAALVWAAVLHKRLRMLTPDSRRLLRDMEGKTIQEVVRDLVGNMEFLSTRLGRVQLATDELERKLTATIQHHGLVRYNADPGLGGELSFALALLDGEQSGVLLTCLHTLDDCRLYVRQVQHGACAHDLSDEEAEALDSALRRCPTPRENAGRVRRVRWRQTDTPRRDSNYPLSKRGEISAE